MLHEFNGITFLRIADGHGGHTQILGLFHESLPADTRGPVRVEATSLHHFALEIDLADFDAELARLRALGVEVATVEHRWCRWRSLFLPAHRRRRAHPLAPAPRGVGPGGRRLT